MTHGARTSFSTFEYMNAGKQSKRVFVGIKVSDEIAECCVKLQVGLVDLPARFIPPDDIHLTLLPPWEMTDEDSVLEQLRVALCHTKRCTLKLQRLSYGPNSMRPRLLWIECAPVSEIILLKKELSKAFAVHDRVPFVPHVTIARFKKEDRDKLVHRPVERSVRLRMPVDSVELFQSPHRGGSGYTVLASVPIPSDSISH